jgi:hypothetical protein
MSFGLLSGHHLLRFSHRLRRRMMSRLWDLLEMLVAVGSWFSRHEEAREGGNKNAKE